MLTLNNDTLHLILHSLPLSKKFLLKSISKHFYSIINQSFVEKSPIHSLAIKKWKKSIQKIYPLVILKNFSVIEFYSLKTYEFTAKNYGKENNLPIEKLQKIIFKNPPEAKKGTINKSYYFVTIPVPAKPYVIYLGQKKQGTITWQKLYTASPKINNRTPFKLKTNN